ncbi:uncharacterized protein A1O9_09627 [Exophiala aquamarina CBS 119918]|uniref:CENP-V/GFA domain-containing protein n=1 Tax=Exophiala aquamarina CBS 119918 TaxID=1182545 RepID=A0A072PFY3_9EURO|nr:uncharacterized protein A1O9_09627 [Exophiala aquamarina CBS 119918]KEF54460.1 hypothetical protein A1O9_09627 [Exophiala aquamarina CBS 119918]
MTKKEDAHRYQAGNSTDRAIDQWKHREPYRVHNKAEDFDSPFQWAAIFHKGDINFTHGHHDLGWYDPTNKDTSHHLPCKVSCAFCRSPIMDEGRNMILLFPPLIKNINSKEAREAFKPTCHMFYPQRVAEFRGDGIVKWQGLDNQSDLVDDDGNVLVKFEEGMKDKDMDQKKRKHLELTEDDEVEGVKTGKNGSK